MSPFRHMAHMQSHSQTATTKWWYPLRPLLSITDQAVVSFSNFATFAIIAQALNPTATGTYALFFATLVVMTSVSNALIFMPSKVSADEDQPTMMQRQQRLLTLLVGFNTVVLASAATIAQVSTSHLIILVAAYVTQQFHEFARTRALTALQSETTLKIDLSAHVPRVLLMCMFWLVGIDLLDAYLILIPISYCCWIFVYPICTSSSVRSPIGLARQAATNWRFGRWLLLESTAYTVSVQGYTFAISWWLGLEELGGLAAALNLLNAANILFMGIATYALPAASRLLAGGDYIEWRRFLLTHSSFTVLMTTAIVAVLAAYSESIMQLLYGDKYVGYAYILVWLASSHVCQSLVSLAAVAFQSAKQPRVGLFVKGIAGVFTLAWVYPALKLWGLTGAIIGIGLTPILWLLGYAIFVGMGQLGVSHVLNQSRADSIRIS